MAYSYKRIPYGLANFRELRRKNCYYVDKTHFIPVLEEMGEYLFLIRPRRMGKSLWLSVLYNYYDIAGKDNFDELFGDLWIAEQPTEERSSYLMLKFNFSTVDPDIRRVEESFETDGQIIFSGFIEKYQNYFDEKFITKFEKLSSTSAKLKQLFQYASTHNLKIYVIIDEYDNFANTILSTAGEKAYRDLTHGAGFYRHFFNVLKGGAGEEGGGGIRLFITGVSPITMDDVTSGYNIGKLVSLEESLNEFMGFTEDEVLAMIDYYRSVDKFPLSTADVLPVMREWYDSYRFSKRAQNSIFNTDMTLYFIDAVIRNGRPPDDLIDHNVRIDYGKLRHLLTVERQLNGNFSRLKKIMETGKTEALVTTSFPVEQLKNTDNFHSLLYFFGLLSFGTTERGVTMLRVPNRTVRKLMYGYLRDAYRDVGIFRLQTTEFARLIRLMAYDGEWEPVFDCLAELIKTQTSVRDYMQGEKVIQGFLLAYLNVTDYFQSRSEFEMGKGFVDFFLEPFFMKFPDMEHGYLVEIKYIPRSEKKSGEQMRIADGSADTKSTLDKELLEKNLSEAREQLERYAADDFVREGMGTAKLHKLALVFHGWELVLRSEV